jgi:DNA-binding response OmpR family regulator
MIFNVEKYTVNISNQQLNLLLLEYKLLYFFMTRPNKTYTRAFIFKFDNKRRKIHDKQR